MHISLGWQSDPSYPSDPSYRSDRPANGRPKTENPPAMSQRVHCDSGNGNYLVFFLSSELTPALPNFVPNFSTRPAVSRIRIWPV